MHQAAQDVPAHIVRPQRMIPRTAVKHRRRETCRQIDKTRIMRRKIIRQHARQDKDQPDRQRHRQTQPSPPADRAARLGELNLDRCRRAFGHPRPPTRIRGSISRYDTSTAALANAIEAASTMIAVCTMG